MVWKAAALGRGGDMARGKKKVQVGTMEVGIARVEVVIESQERGDREGKCEEERMECDIGREAFSMGMNKG